MKITLLKQQVNDANRVSVFVDNEYAFSLTLDQVIEEKIKKGLELDLAQLDTLKALSDEGKLRARALEWLLRRPHSTKEFRDYCYRKKIDKDLSEKLQAEFQDRGYIDDQKFAQWFSEQRFTKGKSARAVQSELASKGIDSAIASEIVATAQDDGQALKRLVSKLRTRSRYQDDKKLTANLIGKGFQYADVKRVLEQPSDE